MAGPNAKEQRRGGRRAGRADTAKLTLEEREELTPEQYAATITLATRAANFAIDNAATKFTAEQRKKIRENAGNTP